MRISPRLNLHVINNSEVPEHEIIFRILNENALNLRKVDLKDDFSDA